MEVGQLHLVDDAAREAAIARLHEVFSAGAISLKRFSDALDGVLGAASRADLGDALSGLPPVVTLTPVGRRLRAPLVLDAPAGGTYFAECSQLAARTTVRCGTGRTLLDLAAASWDALEIDLRLESWGRVTVIVPEGVAVQLAGGLARVALGPLRSALPGAPLLRISAFGPAGSVSVRHPRRR
jgi:hypothetical protein